MKRISAFFITIAVMCASVLSGCNEKIYITTGLKESEIFKISGEECRLAEMLLILMTEKSRYEMELGEGIWQSAATNNQMILEDEIKQKVKNELIELKIIERFADSQEVVVTEEEKQQIKLAAAEYMLTLSEEEKNIIGVTPGDVESLYTSFCKARKVYEKITSDMDIEISDEEARVIEVNYIFIATCRLDENNNKIKYSEEEINEVMAKLEQIDELIDKGNDFVTLAQQHSDSDVYNRKFARGEMVEEFEKVAYNLQVGEISDAVSTDDGYYFIYCISDYLKDETELKKSEKEDAIKKAAYDNLYNPYKSNQTLEFNDKIWDGVELVKYNKVDTSELYSIYNKYIKQ